MVHILGDYLPFLSNPQAKLIKDPGQGLRRRFGGPELLEFAKDPQVLRIFDLDLAIKARAKNRDLDQFLGEDTQRCDGQKNQREHKTCK